MLVCASSKVALAQQPSNYFILIGAAVVFVAAVVVFVAAAALVPVPCPVVVLLLVVVVVAAVAVVAAAVVAVSLGSRNLLEKGSPVETGHSFNSFYFYTCMFLASRLLKDFLHIMYPMIHGPSNCF